MKLKLNIRVTLSRLSLMGKIVNADWSRQRAFFFLFFNHSTVNQSRTNHFYTKRINTDKSQEWVSRLLTTDFCYHGFVIISVVWAPGVVQIAGTIQITFIDQILINLFTAWFTCN